MTAPRPLRLPLLMFFTLCGLPSSPSLSCPRLTFPSDTQNCPLPLPQEPHRAAPDKRLSRHLEFNSSVSVTDFLPLIQGMVDFWLYIVHRRIRSQFCLSTSCDHGQVAYMFFHQLHGENKTAISGCGQN